MWVALQQSLGQREMTGFESLEDTLLLISNMGDRARSHGMQAASRSQ